ncbi:MAG: amino acid adenylation domain-containing protein [Pseudomonadota bacterium]
MIYALHQTVTQAASAEPSRDAFRCADDRITYEELACDVERLARVLCAAGVRRGDRVGVYMDKCIEMPVVVHGIMRAGAAYVPLDPLAPSGRLRDVIIHCGIRIVVTAGARTKSLRPVVLSPTPLRLVVGVSSEALDAPGLDAVPWETVRAESGCAPDVSVMEQDLAYIIYTSGSTGVPKGIMHTHASGLAYAKLSVAQLQVSPEDRIGAHAPLTSDMSTFGLFAGPLASATAVLIPEVYSKLPASLSELMARERITVWYSVPFVLAQLLLRGALDKRDLSSLRWVTYAGESLAPKYLDGLMQAWPFARFGNIYGPAEVNQCTFYEVPSKRYQSDQPIPIGWIWDNSEGLIVDEDDKPVAIGEVGELLVRSPTMMQGYWNNPERNDRAFFERIGSGGQRDRFYRTGDLVREADGGCMEFLGRKDRLIKVLGFRVELDEVEAAFASHQDVIEAAAYPAPGPDDSQAVEVSVTTRAPSVDLTELKRHAGGILPKYALPRTIARVDEFPRTSSGKIDRSALSRDAYNKQGR